MIETLALAVVAPSPLVRAGVQASLAEAGHGDAPRHEWVLAAATLESARLRHYGGARVVVVADALAGPAVAAEAAAEAGPAWVWLVPASVAPRDVAAALAAGVGVVSERAEPAAWAAALEAAAAGLVATDAATWATALLAAEPRTAATPPDLTPREREVLRHLSEGRANREIAQALRISPHTAKFHVGQIIAKLQASSRAHAVAKALRHGWVEA